jgi:hypothetical protein
MQRGGIMVKRALSALVLFLVGAQLASGANDAAPSGSTLHCRLSQTLNTKLNFRGDTFTATVTEPLMVNGQAVIPYGSTLEGQLADVQRPGRVKGVGWMRLTVAQVKLPDGRSFPVNAVLMNAYGPKNVEVKGDEGRVDGPSAKAKTALVIGGLAGGGAVVGLMFGQPLVGMAVGGTVGLVDRMMKRGPDLTLPAGTLLDYQLTRELVISR